MATRGRQQKYQGTKEILEKPRRFTRQWPLNHAFDSVPNTPCLCVEDMHPLGSFDGDWDINIRVRVIYCPIHGAMGLFL